MSTMIFMANAPKKVTKKELKRLEKRETNKKFKEWANKVKDRDEWKCVICDSKKLLNAHHIIDRTVKDYRFDVNNGITLCANHHQFSREISPHKQGFVFTLWLINNRPLQLSNIEGLGKMLKISERRIQNE